MLAIIPAAGSGSRFGGGTKKQFLKLEGQFLLEWVLTTFVDSQLFSRIVVSTSLADLPVEFQKWSQARVNFIEGGSTRFESIQRGFNFLNPADEDIVLIHDAARPNVTQQLLKLVAQAMSQHEAVIPVVPLHDTIKELKDGLVVRTIDRNQLFAVQTPQGFQAKYLKQVYRGAQGDLGRFTDEAKALEELGIPVYTVPGDPTNIKVTTPQDLKLAEFFLSSVNVPTL